MNAIDKIQKLMALALNNSNAEEAASAALKACELIRNHKIVLTSPTPDVSEPIDESLPFDQAAWASFVFQRAMNVAAQREKERWAQRHDDAKNGNPFTRPR